MRPAVWRYIGINGKMALDFTENGFLKYESRMAKHARLNYAFKNV